MMKKYKTRDLKPDQDETTVQSESLSETYICIKECVMVGVGMWKAGEEVTGAVVDHIKHNPNFVKKQEVK